MSFVHLHRHSEWSLLDGTGSAATYAKKAKSLKQDALAITDHGTLAGVLHHINACEAEGIKPIIGMEAYFRYSRTDRSEQNKKAYHLVLLAKNMTGYHNLIRLATEAHRSGYWYKPCIDWDLLVRYREGLIATSACMSSQLGRLLLADQHDTAQKWIDKMVGIFGRDDLYLEIQPGESEEQRTLNLALVEMAKLNKLELIATSDVHYPEASWRETQDVLLMCSTGQTVTNRQKKRDEGEDVYSMIDCTTLYMMDEIDIMATFRNNSPGVSLSVVNRAIWNTQQIAERIEEVKPDRSIKLPKVRGMSPVLTIRGWCNEGLRRIGKSEEQEYLERMSYELRVIEDQGVTDFFIILGDVVRWAKSQKIRVGIGRGSAAGSLVSYLIGITGIDPIAHGLMFERFLNPNRKVMPDIDVDFQHDRRHEVVDYIVSKYGADHVAQVSAYQRFGPRAVLQDVGRVLDLPYQEMVTLTKTIDDAKGTMSLDEIRKTNKRLADWADRYPKAWQHCLRLEGTHKSLSKHPAGVVITDKPIEEYMPLIRSKDGDLVTAWSESKDFQIISDFGFLKMDLLMTDSLTIQAHTLDLIEKRHGEAPDIDNLPVMSDPHDCDSSVLDAFARRQTVGCFQFEGSSISGLLRKMEVDHFNDLVAANALHRPGPMQGGMLRSYYERKHGREDVDYWHPDLVPTQAETYGLMVYQEQVMRVFMVVGGMSAAEADDVRRAVGKKDVRKMSGYKEQFAKGARKNGFGDYQINDIWDKILYFAGYGFNKSHSAAYSAQAYQDGFLKVNYPLEFYTSLATFERDKIGATVREARMFGARFLPPSVQFSKANFSIERDFEGEAIRYGLASIKHVGTAGAAAIEAAQPFVDIDDFMARIKGRLVNSRMRDILSKIGAFEAIGGDPPSPGAQKEFLGVAFDVDDDIVANRELYLKLVMPESDVREQQSGEYVRVGGEIVAIKQITTRKGQPMAFLDLAFEQDVYSITVFTGKWMEYREHFKVGQGIFVYGPYDAERDCIVMEDMRTTAQLLEEMKHRQAMEVQP
jgi:DNA polymerase-3 subunit alpha